MNAACHTQIAVRRLPAHVIVARAGHRIAQGGLYAGAPDSSLAPVKINPPHLLLRPGDEIKVLGAKAFTMTLGGNVYRLSRGTMQITCRSARIGLTASRPATRMTVVALTNGSLTVVAGTHARRSTVLTRQMLAFATHSNTRFTVTSNPGSGTTDATTSNYPIVTARAGDQQMRVALQPTYTAISDRQGIRLNVWPFPLSPLQRPVRASDALPEYWDDGSPCATGCGGGYVHGWPLKPFHQQHAVRAGIDEIRPANLHVAVDIQADAFEPVYAIQSGYAYSQPTGSLYDYKVTVGRFTYWHVHPSVANGHWVTAYKTVIGHVEDGQGHMAFEEGGDNSYLNPLRPGGPLTPYTDTVPPVIGQPEIFSDGDAVVPAFDPQSFVHRQTYLTPVLALAGLAWRLYNAKGRPVTGLQWALRASGYLSPALKYTIFTPGSYNPGYACFATEFICKPNWVYNLAGGLTGPLPFDRLPPGHYRLSVYAWDFKGNESALDEPITLPLKGSDAITGDGLASPFDPFTGPR